MPLSFAKQGEEMFIKKTNGKDETIKFLESLGFTIGSSVTVISELGGNLIVSIKNSRIAIDRTMANRIIV
jgi:ferrous iron transport protein A